MLITKKTSFENFPVTTEKSKSIVITGGCGFIGSNLIKAFNNIGFSNIIVIDGLGLDGKWKNLRGLSYRDIMLPEEFVHWAATNDLVDVDTVIHLGASTDTTETNGDNLLINNYTFSKSLYTLCRDSETRFIYASSAATYGDGLKGFKDSAPISTYDGSALNPYGYSKQLLDRYIFESDEDDDVTVGLKFFNVYGPNEGHKGKMASIISQKLDVSHVSLFKIAPEKGAMRDFIYIKDVTNIILSIHRNKGISGMFNVGTGIPRSWKDVVEAISKAKKQPVDIDYIEMPNEIRDQYQYYTCADTTKLTEVIGSYKFFTLEEGIQDYVNDSR